MQVRVFLGALCSVLLLGALVGAEIDDKVLSKDLYGALEISQEASAGEIKKAYRTLARKYHPDKAKSEREKEENERKFVEIAEAHEILVDDNLRGEYDYHRQFGMGAFGRGPQQGGGRGPRDAARGGGMYQDGAGESYEYMFQGGEGGDVFEMFEDLLRGGSAQYTQQQYQHQEFMTGQDLFDMFVGGGIFEGAAHGAFSQPPQFQPAATESPLRSNEIITPYSPILVSAGHSHYALLDATCSYKVFSYTSGNIGDFVQLLAEHPISLHEAQGVKQTYKTPEFPSLDGNCFAGLDESGAFSVFEGHPHFEYRTIWTTKERNEGEEIDYHKSLEKRYFLHVTDDGELAVMSLPGTGGRMRRQRGEDREDDRPACTWSSRGCPDDYKGSSKINKKVRKAARVTIKFVSTAVRLIRSLPRYVDAGLDVLDELGPLETARVVLLRSLILTRRILLHVLA